MTLDLAAAAYGDIPLDLNERPHTRLVSDATAIEVRERLHDDALAELHVVEKTIGRVVDREAAQLKYSDTASTTAAIWFSVIPGKIGSDSTRLATPSVTGKVPWA